VIYLFGKNKPKGIVLYTMSENKKRVLHLCLLCTVGALVILVGALLVAECIGIYKSGARPFTRESVGEALKRVIIPSVITVASIIAAAVIDLLLPYQKKTKNTVPSAFLLKTVSKKVPLEYLPSDTVIAVKNERLKRLIFKIGGAVIFVISIIYPLVYVFTPERFGSATTANADIAAAIIAIAIFLIPLCAYTIVVSFINDKSRAREIEILRSASKKVKDSGITLPATEAECSCILKANEKARLINAARLAVLILGVLFVILGISNGGMEDVLGKAVRICTECIGLG